MIKESSIQAMLKLLGHDHVRGLFLAMLHESIMTVEFKKKNGDNRVMKCTTNPKFIEPQTAPRPTRATLEAIRVFDMEKNDWRSFKLETVKSIQPSVPF